MLIHHGHVNNLPWKHLEWLLYCRSWCSVPLPQSHFFGLCVYIRSQFLFKQVHLHRREHCFLECTSNLAPKSKKTGKKVNISQRARAASNCGGNHQVVSAVGWLRRTQTRTKSEWGSCCENFGWPSDGFERNTEVQHKLELQDCHVVTPAPANCHLKRRSLIGSPVTCSVNAPSHVLECVFCLTYRRCGHTGLWRALLLYFWEINHSLSQEEAHRVGFHTQLKEGLNALFNTWKRWCLGKNKCRLRSFFLSVYKTCLFRN